jgi:heme oxygenase
MSDLKTLTWPKHKLAESTLLMQDMLSGNINTELYSDLVYSKHLLYSVIESRISFECADLPRAGLAFQDWKQMGSHPPTMPSSFFEFHEHLASVEEPLLWAHVYVHYLAPLYGGQILKKILSPRFPVAMLSFETPKACIAEIRHKTNASLADEANLSFDFTTRYYDELYQSHYPNS